MELIPKTNDFLGKRYKVPIDDDDCEFRKRVCLEF